MSTKEQNKPSKETADFDKDLTYPPNEDVYNQGMVDPNIDPENPTQQKSSVAPLEEEQLSPVDKNLTRDTPVDDLDVPGAELDDENEMIGEEDEENNYWSLGGDNHENLEEHGTES